MSTPLFGYQNQAADIMAGRARYGLHDEMGIGKTATSIGAVNRILGSRGIVVCPAMLRENWISEFKTFSTYDLKICKGKNRHDFVAWSRNRFDVLITSYEQMTKWTPEFTKTGEFLDFVIFDEAHYMKNCETNRARALLGREASGHNSLVEWCEHAWHVTGTPMANDPLDVFTFLRFTEAIDFDSKEFVSYFFEKKYTTYGARHSVKHHMVGTLRELISNNSTRRTHGEVGLHLPPIFLKNMLIEGSTIELYEALAGYPELEQQIIYALESGDVGMLDAPYIATVRRLIGKAKAVAYAQMLKFELDAGSRKRVAFFFHTEPLLYVHRYLKKHGYDSVIIYGDTSERDRQEAVHRYINDPKCVAILGNGKVMGVGLTLVVGTEIDIVESDWTPAGNAQAIKRVHRLGQEHTVNARFITLAESFDVNVNAIVARKTAEIAEIEGHSMNAVPLDIL